jgi:hypothetical protein
MVVLQSPDQGDDPAEKRPSKEEIQHEDCPDVPLVASGAKDRGQKVHDQPEPENVRRKKKWEVEEDGHRLNLLLIAVWSRNLVRRITP